MASAWTFIITIASGALLMWFARQALTPRWEVIAKVVPRALLHRWSLGTMAVSGLLLVFSVPFLLIGAHAVAAAGLVVVILVMGLAGRDVLAWIVEDIREHWREGRSPFRHGSTCVVHEHYHG